MRNFKKIISTFSLMFAIMFMVMAMPIEANAAGIFDWWWGNSEEEEAPELEHNPVVFVHGMVSTSFVFFPHETYLVNQGWDSDAIVSVELIDKVAFGPINAASISNAVDQLLEKTGADKVDIVAHSMGGANSLYYILNGGADKVDKLVTLGGANTLVTHSAPEGVEVTTISSTTDLIVNPLLSRLRGANNITISGVSHVGLLSDSNVQKLMKEALEQ